MKEIKPNSKHSFDGTVRSLEKELSESTATVTVSAANPMIALAPGKPVEIKHSKDKPDSGKEKKSHKKKDKGQSVAESDMRDALLRLNCAATGHPMPDEPCECWGDEGGEAVRS